MLTPIIELLENIQTRMARQDAEIKRHFDIIRMFNNSGSSL